MKRTISLILSAVLAFACFGTFTGCTPRENRLVICNWGQYIDESILDEFEAEYKEATGIKVKVDYIEFTDNETLYTALSEGGADYDLICPSDYMIETMIDKQMLRKLDKSLIPNYNNISERFRTDENYSAFDPTHEYAVPYFMGTFGIFYNTGKGVSSEDVKSWDALRDVKYKEKVTMKETSRDSMVLGNIFANMDSGELAVPESYDEDFRTKLASVFNDIDANTIAAAKAALLDQKGKVNFRLETNAGKENIAISNVIEALGLYWSCDAAYAMLNFPETGSKLNYSVPDEGGNVWMDGFVMPKDAVNVDAAHAFLDFICREDIAIRNMEEAGGCSAIGSAVDTLKAQYEEDEDGFFDGKSDEWKEMFLDTLFPSDETLERCVMMKAFGNMTDAVNSAWFEVKFS